MNLEFEVVHRTSPSPLNGERAGVRENGPTRSLWFMVPMRARMQVEALPMNLRHSLTFNVQHSNSTLNIHLTRQSLKVERSMLNVESSRLTHPGSWSPHTSDSGDVCHP